jgi:acetyl-CoA carboxylase biotin carboxyl carrier protein
LHDPGSGTKQGKKQYPSHRSSYQNFGIRDTQYAQLSLFFISSVEKSVAFRPFSVSFSVLGKCDKTSIACSPCFVLNDRPQTPTNIDCSPPASTKFNQGRFLDLKQIKQIIELMKRSELTEFAVEEEGFKLKIRRGANGLPVISSGRGSNSPFSGLDTTSSIPAAATNTSSAASVPVVPALAPSDEVGVAYIKSPMVGTFYRAASPESKPFADVGTKVVENTVVCIIEAMKIMNEIQAEAKGTVLEVLVENGQPVEYGQRLFKIKQG